jgi:hypothetical protein
MRVIYFEHNYAAGPKHHFWGRGLSLFLGENMSDFGILWEMESQI